jgi:outer membrane protein
MRYPPSVLISRGFILRISKSLALSVALVLAAPAFAQAGEGGHWWSGDWYLTLGAEGFVAPRYKGSSDYLLQASPLISLGKAGNVTRFTSRNDSASFSLYDTGAVRVGVAGSLIMPRDDDTSSDLKGLNDIEFGVELGGFAEVYPADWLRLRAEVRQGIRSHTGLVADIAADAFMDVVPGVRVSGGPRLSLASSDYMDAYYGVNAKESAASGLSQYDPGGGVQSVGVGGAVNWQTTDKIATSVFAEYSRLTGPAGDSSLVRERGDRNQFLVGVGATYKFGFTLP